MKKLIMFWLPLIATWLMMAAEGPTVTAIIARLLNQKLNLAAHGVAFSLALVVESPIIMMMGAATALVKGPVSYKRLRNLNFALCGLLTLIMLFLQLPPVFDFVATRFLAIEPEVAWRAHLGILLLTPWPAAIGLRRFYQGVLIRSGQTKKVAQGTIIRLLAMASASLGLYFFGGLEGIAVGASALSLGVVLESVATRIMAHKVVKETLALPDDSASAQSFLNVAKYYWPLALTSIIMLAAQPFVTFFMGRARWPLESLAVMPVVGASMFIFRAIGISFQEVAITWFDNHPTETHHLKKVAVGAAILTTGLPLILALCSGMELWYTSVSGLRSDLLGFALTPTFIMLALPASEVLLSWQRARLMQSRLPKYISHATWLELGTIGLTLFLLVRYSPFSGAVCAAVAFLFGRILACLLLHWIVTRHESAAVPSPCMSV